MIILDTESELRIDPQSSNPDLAAGEMFARTLERRKKATASLLSSLATLPREKQFTILASFIETKHLEWLAQFKEVRES